MMNIMIRSLVISAAVFLAACGSGSGAGTGSESPTISPTQPHPPVDPVHPYSTTFPLSENPISENNAWINGGAVGFDWTNIHTVSGLAFGTQTNSGGFDDSLSILSGTWGPDQTVIATVHSVNQQTEGNIEELELLLRFTITAHSAQGYEVNFRASHDGSQYVQVVRWNGPLADFTVLQSLAGPGINDGDTVKATIVGNVITAYVNNVSVLSVTDSTYATGNPGMGFYFASAVGTNSDYGFTSYMASDGA